MTLAGVKNGCKAIQRCPVEVVLIRSGIESVLVSPNPGNPHTVRAYSTTKW